MSKLPTLSTPGRQSGSASTGLPTPTARRARSSLGPQPNAFSTPDAEMDEALREVLRTRPPSSMRSQYIAASEDPDTPTSHAHPPSAYLQAGPGKGLAAPRTPAARAKTPSSLGLGLGQPSAPTTPSSSRASSRPSMSGRPSFGGSNLAGQGITPRRTSMASSVSGTTPYGRRPESRASAVYEAQRASWTPAVGENVRIDSQGFEGTLRYLGEVQGKEGIFAGVELSPGFAGRGKNDGSVDGVQYFTCAQNLGIFVQATKLSAPTAGVSRPASVASHRSLASSHASFSLHGRTTPSGRATPSASRPSVVTPGRPRVVTRRMDGDETNPKTTLGTSTRANAGIAITAGSRASKYVGMTAKQLGEAKSGNLSASVRNATPKASRVSMGMSTPGRPRQSMGNSLGNSLMTPRARGPRASTTADMMPPPPSPSNINKAMHAHQAQLEEEIRVLKAKNTEMEQQLRGYDNANTNGQEIAAIRSESEKYKEEADSLRYQLSASQADATDASKLAEELHAAQNTSTEELQRKESELREAQRELKLAAERASEELEVAMEAKTAELMDLREKIEKSEAENQSFSRLVDELSEAGQATIALYESEKFKLDDKIRTLEEKLAKVREERDQAQELAAQRPPSPSSRAKAAVSAAEIDNETLNAQVKHLQNKINNLEEELDERRAELESEAESWNQKVQKGREAEKIQVELVKSLRGEIGDYKSQATSAKNRIGELEGALKETQVALEGARAEIETLRVEAAEASSLRSSLQAASANEKLLADRDNEVTELKSRLSEIEAKGEQSALFEEKITALEAEISTLKAKPADNTAQVDAEKKLRGFQHIIQELSAENAELKERSESLAEETSLLKEEVKLLEEAGEGDNANVKELREARSTIDANEQTIRELNREVSELESLIESKIYREDELEQRAIDLERELDRLRSSSQQSQGHSRQSSINTTGTGSDDRCELCEGPHSLDTCPVFSGEVVDDVPGNAKKTGTFCADCESTEHDTADCPMADDVF